MRRLMRLSLISLALCALLALGFTSVASAARLTSSFANSEKVTVSAPAGVFTGLVEELGNAFHGIPYAKPPVGELRFKAPRPAALGIKMDAFTPGPGCWQDCHLPEPEINCPAKMSEDCLTLSIYSPHNSTASSNHPVMVYFHGGNYKFGFGESRLYDGGHMVSQAGVVLVTVNYRLGAFGFMSIPEAGLEANAAFKDQVLTLQWTQENIAAFGGNPNKVTIFGQSAGGGSVVSHLISPLSKGLFHRAFVQSNPFGIKFRTPASMEKLTGVMAKNVGCGRDAASIPCWYNKTASEIVAAQTITDVDFEASGGSMLQVFLPWTPMTGTTELPNTPNAAMLSGQVHDVPIVIGTVRDESLVFIYQGFNTPVDWVKYAVVVTGIFLDTGKSDAVLKRFPASDKEDNRDKNLVPMGNEYIFNCPQRAGIRGLVSSSARKNPVYMYVFSHVLSFGDKAWETSPECIHKSCHGGELPIEFNSGDWKYPYRADEKALARNFIQYLGNFAHTGNPNEGGVPANGRFADTAVAHASKAAAAQDKKRGCGKSVEAVAEAETETEEEKALLALAGMRSNSAAAAAENDSLSLRGVEVEKPAVEWPAWSVNAQNNIWLSSTAAEGVKVTENYYKDQCDFWDTIGYVE